MMIHQMAELIKAALEQRDKPDEVENFTHYLNHLPTEKTNKRSTCR